MLKVSAGSLRLVFQFKFRNCFAKDNYILFFNWSSLTKKWISHCSTFAN